MNNNEVQIPPSTFAVSASFRANNINTDDSSPAPIKHLHKKPLGQAVLHAINSGITAGMLIILLQIAGKGQFIFYEPSPIILFFEILICLVMMAINIGHIMEVLQ